jgi:hypothetical protein
LAARFSKSEGSTTDEPARVAAAHEAETFIEDPTAAGASHFGVAREEFVLWRALRAFLACCRSKNGRTPGREAATASGTAARRGKMADAIEVFSDLYLRGPAAAKAGLRKALAVPGADPWSYDEDRSAEIKRNTVSTEEVLVFRRRGEAALPAASLTLWERPDGFYVSNIVPTEASELSYGEYNALLQDFADKVARPVAEAQGCSVEITPGRQRLEDWVSPVVAEALRRFSSAANKSTGASHPMDQKRWFAFLLAAHRSAASLDADRLARWLYQAHGWDEDSAHELAGDYERAMALLDYAASH